MKKTTIYLFMLGICFFGTACGSSLVVNSSGDEPDKDLNDGVCETVNNECTLRAAIMEANLSDDVSFITFENVTEIAPTSALPPLTASNTHINGEGVVTLNGNPHVGGTESGLKILGSSYNIIQGLLIKHFNRGVYILAGNGNAQYNVIGLTTSGPGYTTERNILIQNNTGIEISGQGASDNTVTGNYIGTGFYGGISYPNTSYGVNINNGANHNLIGSISGSGVLQGGNLISGNDGVGINLSSVSHNHITGNYIGTKKDGNSPLPNSDAGIRITNGSHNNFIGIAPTGEGNPNLISGNTYEGLFIADSNHNYIAGNYIGTNQSGTGAIPNLYGIRITSGASTNIIGTNGDGTADSAEGNVISGNEYGGIDISDQNSNNNVIAGNFIGTNFDGTTSLGNGGSGITVSGDYNRIGTNGDGVSDSLEVNIVSGNMTNGITIDSAGNLVSGNFIGTDKTGMLPIGNQFSGIFIHQAASNNLIGTDGDGVADAAESNIISGNAVGLYGSGIAINGDDNIVAGNYIGTDATGNTGLGNLRDGISLGNSASGNLIGTEGDGTADDIEGNLISGNGKTGISLIGAYANTVAGNLIGTNISGTAAIPNGHAASGGYGAVYLWYGASGNVIGTNSDGANDAAEGNLISGNVLKGIAIKGATTHFNIIAGNKIGTDISGSSALGNWHGIEIWDGASYNRIGTNGDGNSDIAERNLISANSGPGIHVRGSHNQIAGNFIGTDYFGTADLGNGTHGISIEDTSTENTIGGSYQKANLIAFNGKDGIQVSGMNADKTLISHNSIHSNYESGIDLAEGQVLWFSPNDPGDIDLGPNDMMNFPVLDSASALPAIVTITGQIVDGLPNTNFEIQFFVNDVCDSPAGHGEGKTYIGSTNEITDGSGDVSFLSSFASGVTAGQFITATATTDNKTSEFSACVEVIDVQTYSLELEEDRCGQFDQDEMTLVTFPVDPELLVLNLYVKKPSEYPGQSPDDPEEWVYTAFLGDIEARKCNFQGFAERLYCDFIIPENFINTTQELKVFVNLCTPPIYISKNVSIFLYEPPPKEELECSSEMGERKCIAAGGTYTCGVSCSCTCP